jgi:acyl carrier protein
LRELSIQKDQEIRRYLMKIESTLENFIVEEIMLERKGTALDPEESLLNSGILDSLGLLRLIAFIEESFGIEVEDGEVVPENFDSIGAMNKFLKMKMANNESG